MSDISLAKWLILLLILPLGIAIFGGDRYRYPCQDPTNWDKDICKMPTCDVNRTCPEHIFKGQRDPRLGPPDANSKPTTAISPAQQSKGLDCGK
jgi:hypothetical protein